jgi:FixJ family two-component response regulator
MHHTGVEGQLSANEPGVMEYPGDAKPLASAPRLGESPRSNNAKYLSRGRLKMSAIIAEPTVFLVDDDAQIVRALSRGLAAEGFSVRSWTDALTFLREHDPAAPGCLVTDVAMPSLSGLELQTELVSSGCMRPIVFITGKGDIPMSVQAMRAGAVTFLPKPVRLADLAAAVREAIDRDVAIRESCKRRATIDLRLNALTPREREVLTHVVNGKMNKQIAASLGAAEKTVKVHRGRVMRKMHVRSVAELVLITSQLAGTASGDHESSETKVQ